MEHIGQLNAAIYRHIVFIIDCKMADLPIRSGNHIFLFAISNQEGITQKELCEQLHISKSTTAKAIKHLTGIGYIIKKRDLSDKRFTRLYLTESGRAAAPHVQKVILDIRKTLISDLTEAEVKQATGLLNKVLTNILTEKQRLMSGRNQKS